jgi:hypothetical protein
VRHDVPAAADVTPTVNGVIVDEPDPTTTAPTEKLEAIAQLRADRAVAARNALADGPAAPTLPSQATLAGQLGTTAANGTYMSHVPGVLNGYESRSTYVYVSDSSLTDLRDQIQVDIQNYTAPLQFDVQISLLPWYAGSVSGKHDIAGYGYYYATKVANAYVYDPWTDSRAGRKTIGTSSLYDAMAPDGHHLVW